MATPVKAAYQLIAAGTSNAAGATTRGTADLRTVFGGVLTIKVTNGATGPTVAPTINILIAHTSVTTPTAASAGTNWKTIASFGGDSVNNSINEWNYEVPAGIMHIEVEITGNTAQAITCEAFMSQITSIG
jgi:phage tail sheath gpL-like